MSGCYCAETTRYRVTGEVWARRDARDAIGGGPKVVRVRCAECGGKIGAVGSDLLELLGVDVEEIRTGRVLPEDDRPTLEVDLC